MVCPPSRGLVSYLVSQLVFLLVSQLVSQLVFLLVSLCCGWSDFAFFSNSVLLGGRLSKVSALVLDGVSAFPRSCLLSCLPACLSSCFPLWRVVSFLKNTSWIHPLFGVYGGVILRYMLLFGTQNSPWILNGCAGHRWSNPRRGLREPWSPQRLQAESDACFKPKKDTHPLPIRQQSGVFLRENMGQVGFYLSRPLVYSSIHSFLRDSGLDDLYLTNTNQPGFLI